MIHIIINQSKRQSLFHTPLLTITGWWLGHPLWKIWLRQFRDDDIPTQYFWENSKLMATKPPTRYNDL